MSKGIIKRMMKEVTKDAEGRACLDYCNIAYIAGVISEFTFQKTSSFFSVSFLIPSVFSVTYRH